MPRLEDITVGSQINGIAAGESVTVIAVQWYGDAAAEVTFKNSKGQLASQILYRDDENRIEVLANHLPWSFDADADRMRLVSEAYRINLAHIFDPLIGILGILLYGITAFPTSWREPAIDNTRRTGPSMVSKPPYKGGKQPC